MRKTALLLPVVGILALAGCGPAEVPLPKAASPPSAAPNREAEQGKAAPAQISEVQVSGVGFSPAAGGFVIEVSTITGEQLGTRVHLIVGQREAEILQAKLARQSFPRPMTHDLTVSLLGELGGRLQQVVVEDLVDDTFLARLYFHDREGRMHTLDSRASDAIILGVSTRSKIYFTRKVLNQAGIKPDPQAAGPAI